MSNYQRDKKRASDGSGRENWWFSVQWRWQDFTNLCLAVVAVRVMEA